ncbi:uncharacterized protein LOC125498623 [Beta vulgaris subsp. vulgaris]|uniref:uncharacterized protein LOC125498623 n=1 Tax=Beta vulgaris subsp. vulgaris TaxID=3555 RepID=UPI002036EDF5|nr:uncharacterized protein LOC125498623 [Beta vulgaris subsp. vulgaris]
MEKCLGESSSRTHSEAVYGLHTILDRKSLWSGLLGHVQSQELMIIIGDYNVIFSSNDRANWTLVTDAETVDFEDFLLQSSLIEVKSIGLFYSQSNSSVGSERVVRKIDKTFVNHAWLTMYAGVVMQYLALGISDHSPLKSALQADSQQGGRPFKFMNIMIDRVDFLDTVDKSWSSVNKIYKPQSVWLKLKAAKKDLKMMHTHKFGKAHDKVEYLRQKLSNLQSQSDFNSNREAQSNAKGDANSKFFFTIIKARHAQNSIDMLTDDNGRLITGAQEIKEEILAFYKKLLGSKAPSLSGIDLNVVRAGKSISMQARESLVRDVTHDEIEKALAGIGNDKVLDWMGLTYFLRKAGLP